MKKTPNLNLPVYDTPSVDTFKVEDWNNANENIDYVFGELKNNPNVNAIDIKAREDIINNHRSVTEQLGSNVQQINLVKNTKSDITYVDTKVARLSSTTPKIVNTISEMVDISINYVLSTDGYIYHHNGTGFINSNVKYQGMVIQNNSIDSTKLNINEINDLSFDKFTNSNFIIGTEKEINPLYVYTNPNVIQDETTKTLSFTTVIYCDEGYTCTFIGKVYSNDTNDNSITGQEVVQNSSWLTLKKGFNIVEMTFIGVKNKYAYHKILPKIKIVPTKTTNSIYMTKPYCSSGAVISSLIKYNVESILENIKIDKQLTNLDEVKKFIQIDNDLINSKVAKYFNDDYSKVVFNNTVATTGVKSNVITLPLSAREQLKDYGYKFPKGTIFKYDLEIENLTGTIDTIGLQIFQSPNQDEGYVIGDGYMQVGLFNISTTKVSYFKELTADSNFDIKSNNYIKLYLDLKFSANTSCVTTYRNFKIILPNGVNVFSGDIKLFNGFGITSSTPPKIAYEDYKPVMYKDLNSFNFASRWSGKTYYSEGDSITWEHNNQVEGSGKVVGYQKYVVDKLGCALVNNGVSGQTIADFGVGDSNNFTKRYMTRDWTKVDLVTIALGTNDVNKHCPLGDNIEVTDITTFTGAWNTVLRYIFTQNPNIRVVLIAPPKWKTYRNPNNLGLKLKNYVDRLHEIASNWSVPIFSAYDLAGWNDATFDVFTYDGLHGSSAGFKVYGERLAEFLNTI